MMQPTKRVPHKGDVIKIMRNCHHNSPLNGAIGYVYGSYYDTFMHEVLFEVKAYYVSEHSDRPVLTLFDCTVDELRILDNITGEYV